MICLHHVSFSYGRTPALRDVSMEIQPGDFVGIVGPNSSGKSTLLKIISGLRKPQEGQVLLLEKSLDRWALPDIARTLTMVSSEHYFVFPFTAEQVVLMGRIPFVPRGRRENVRDWEIVRQAMEETDVWALRARSIHQLSSGERQRVLLARALAQEPRLLLLDEPAAHLDIGHQWALFDLLKRLHQDRKLTVICALHDLNLAAQYSQRLLLLCQGQVQAMGSPKAVLTPKHLQDVFGVQTTIQWSETKGRQNFILNRS